MKEKKNIIDDMQEVLEKTDINEKIVDGTKNNTGKIGSLFTGKIVEK